MSEEYEKVMDRFFRKGSAHEPTSAANQAVDAYNRWNRERSGELAASAKEADRRLEDLRALEKELSGLGNGLKDKPRPGDARAAADYNRRVLEYNRLADRYRELAATCRTMVDRHNAAVEAFTKEQADRGKAVEELRARAGQASDEYRAFFEKGEDLRFFKRLCTDYAALAAECRRPEAGPEARQRLRALAVLRQDLGNYAIAQNRKQGNGLIVVQVWLADKEPAFMLVDTGATICTISPELVSALGWQDVLGKEAELTLAGGIKIKGPTLPIPALSVYGQNARNVSAVVLEPTQAGVDGILGHSFLDRFHYRIEKGHEPPLMLSK